MKKPKPQVPLVHYNPLTTSKCQEINDKVSDFYNTLSEFATSNRLNLADVTRHPFGGELKGAKLNYWKCFQLIRGMAQSDRKFIFRLWTYRIIEWNYCSVVVWDDALLKLIGQDAPAWSAGGSGKDEKADDEDDEDKDEDAEAEPDVPALLSDTDFKYDPWDPVGLRLGKLLSDDAAQYHVIKSACIKAGWLEEWKQSLRNTVIELSSTLLTQSLTNAQSKKAVKKITQELQHYVCPSTLIHFRIWLIDLWHHHSGEACLQPLWHFCEWDHSWHEHGHAVYSSLALSQNSSIFSKTCCGVHKRSNNTF